MSEGIFAREKGRNDNAPAILMSVLIFVGDKYTHSCSAVFARLYCQCALAHHREPFTDVFERYMRLVVVVFTETRTRVPDGDFASVVGFARGDVDVRRVKLGSYTVLYRVFDNRLQCQRRKLERRVRSVKLHEHLALKSDLLHGEVRARVFQLLRERDCAVLRNLRKVRAQIMREV